MVSVGVVARFLKTVTRASFTITRLVRTVLPPPRYGVMRGDCLVELSFPGGETRVPFQLAGDAVAY